MTPPSSLSVRITWLLFAWLCSGIFVARLLAASSPSSPVSVSSPDKSIVVGSDRCGSFELSGDGGRQTRADSRRVLACGCGDGGVLGSNVTLLKVDRSEEDTTWQSPLGKRRTVRDHYRQIRLSLSEKSGGGHAFDLIVRVSDDGVGFRYSLPAGFNAREWIIDEELTEFSFVSDAKCYAGDYSQNPPEESRGGFAGSQEWEYRKRSLSELPVETVTGLPLLAQTPAAWVAVAEADLVDWSGMWLARSPSTPGATGVTLRTRLAPSLIAGEGLVKVTLPHDSPWRVLMIGRTPGKLVESDLILNLSTPSRLPSTSWIKPGLMAWDHWWSGDTQMDTATIKEYIQLACG